MNLRKWMLAPAAAVAMAVILPTSLAGAQATGSITRITVDYQTGADANGASTRAQISPDGGFMCFESTATDLVAGDTHHGTDVFLADLATQTVERVSVDATTGGDSNGTSDFCAISENGTYVDFTSSSTDLVAGKTFGGTQVYQRDMATGVTTLVSWNDKGNGPGNAASDRPTVSANGQYVAFNSDATNIVVGATTKEDVYVRDMVNRVTTAPELASAMALTGTDANGPSVHAVISSDGTHVAYESRATNLVAPASTNPATLNQIYETNLQTGVTILVSANNVNGGFDNARNQRPAINATGQYVAWESPATDLVSATVPGNQVTEIYMRDTVNNITTVVSVDTNGNPLTSSSSRPSLTGDGSMVAFEATAHNVVSYPVSRRQVYVRNLQTGTNSLVSFDTAGTAGGSCPAAGPNRRAAAGPVGAPPAIATRATIDAAGDRIGFVSSYCNLVSSPTSNPPVLDVYVWTAPGG